LNPDGRDSRALLVSGGLGMGHEVTARTCAASLEARGWSTQTLDAMELLGGRGGTAGEAVFRAMLAMPGLYDAFHFAALRPGNRLALRIDAAARRRLVPRLREHLDACPAGLVISVFSTGASAISALASRYPGMTHVVFCTDVTPHRLWVHPNVDLYLVTSHVAECAIRRFQPGARVLVMPPPVRPGFYAVPPQEEARARLGIPRGARCVLLMSGGWGLGPVAAAAAALADAGLYVLAVAGRNAALEARLRALQQRQPRVRAFGYTDRIPELMAACDLVITSSGDTCTEARTVGRNLLLLDVVPGHGRDNLQHELELGNASVTSSWSEAIVANTLALLDKGAAEQGTSHQTAPGRAPAGGTGPDGRAAGLEAARGMERWEAAFSAALAAAGVGAKEALVRGHAVTGGDDPACPAGRPD
jgi:processive 1,2-diacylglycerol beta-glucosyltransferase